MIKRMNIQATAWEKLFTKDTFDKGLFPKKNTNNSQNS